MTLEKCQAICEIIDECYNILWNDIGSICTLLDCSIWDFDSSRPTQHAWAQHSICNEAPDCHDSTGPYCLSGLCFECVLDEHCYEPNFPFCDSNVCVEKPEIL